MQQKSPGFSRGFFLSFFLRASAVKFCYFLNDYSSGLYKFHLFVKEQFIFPPGHDHEKITNLSVNKHF